MNWVHPASLMLATFVVAFLESWLSGVRQLAAAQPDLMPALIIYAALHTNLGATIATAMLGGLAQDALSSGPFGLSMIPLTLLGVLLHRRRDVLLRDSLWAQALLGGAGALTVFLVSLGLLFVLWPLVSNGGPPHPHLPERSTELTSLPIIGVGILWQVFVVTVVGVMATPACFRVFRWVERTFHFQPVLRPIHRGDREIKRGRS